MYRIAICDDDEKYREIVRKEIEKQEITDQKIEFYEYGSAIELLKEINLQHDLVFLDVKMPELDGNEAAKILRQNNKMAVLVFCTNYYCLSPETIKVRPFRYIVKDLKNKNLKNELPDILNEMVKEAQIQYVTVSGKTFVKRIPINDILYIAIAKYGAEIMLFDGEETVRLKCRETVRELYDDLKYKGFEYAHNSYIVNLSNIISREKQTIRLKDNTELNIARASKVRFEERMFDFFYMGRYE